MKLSKKAQRCLLEISTDLREAIQFVMKDSTVLCVQSKGHTTIEYVNKEGEYITAIMKETGSGICYLYNARKDLESFIKLNS